MPKRPKESERAGDPKERKMETSQNFGETSCLKKIVGNTKNIKSHSNHDKYVQNGNDGYDINDDADDFGSFCGNDNYV